MEYTRNSDFKYYDSHPCDTNCGSYALRLNEWYDAENKFEEENGYIGDWIVCMIEEGYSDSEITEIYEYCLIEDILTEFEGELEISDNTVPDDPSTELIAFNAFCASEEGIDFPDWDFHFRVFRDGVWKEKNGSDSVQECDINNWGRYTGEVTYFWHKIQEVNCESKGELI